MEQRSRTVGDVATAYRSLVANWRHWFWPLSPQIVAFVFAAAMLGVWTYVARGWLFDSHRSLADWHLFVFAAIFLMFSLAQASLTSLRRRRAIESVRSATGAGAECLDEAKAVLLQQLFGVPRSQFGRVAIELDSYLRVLRGVRRPTTLALNGFGKYLLSFIYDPESKQRLVAWTAMLVAGIVFLSRGENVGLPDALALISADPSMLFAGYARMLAVLGILLLEIAALRAVLTLLLAEVDRHFDTDADIRLVFHDLMLLYQVA